MWYSIEAIFSTFVNDLKDKDPVTDKIIFLINLKEEDNLEKKINIMAKKFEIEYFNYLQEKISWRLIKIINILELEEEIYDGIEVFSTIKCDDQSSCTKKA